MKGHLPWNKGKIFSNEYKMKLSNAHKNQIPYNKGKSMSKEQKEKISASQKARWTKIKSNIYIT